MKSITIRLLMWRGIRPWRSSGARRWNPPLAVGQRSNHSLRAIIDGESTWRAPPSPLPAAQLYGGVEGTQRGLFGREGLQSPSDFDRMAQHVRRLAIAEQTQITQSQGEAMNVEQAEEIVHRLDRMSELICGVADPAQLACQVVTEPTWHAAAVQTHLDLQRLISELNVMEVDIVICDGSVIEIYALLNIYLSIVMGHYIAVLLNYK